MNTKKRVEQAYANYMKSRYNLAATPNYPERELAWKDYLNKIDNYRKAFKAWKNAGFP